MAQASACDTKKNRDSPRKTGSVNQTESNPNVHLEAKTDS